MRWFTSDPHFWHKNVIDFCERPWDSVEEMNEGLIENWNRVVRSYDIVYITGDVFFCGVSKAQSIMSRLNGRKRLIRGNHDWKDIKLHAAGLHPEGHPKLDKFGFESVTDSEILDIGGESVMLNHFPYSGDHTALVRYPHLRPHDTGGWLLHGHVHTHWRVRQKQINVGTDVWHYTPVSEDEIRLIISQNKK